MGHFRVLFGRQAWVIYLGMRTNRNVAFDCTYHCVWCPKYRRPVLDEAIGLRLKELIRAVCAERNVGVVEVEVMPDHVHVLVSVDPQYGIHRLVKGIKGRSSRVLREEFPSLKRRLPSLWTNAYYVGTVGGASLATVRGYVEMQKGVSPC